MAYSFTELKDAEGTVNVIAVVKFSRTPIKTRGSGYCLFASITDPSLNGAKLPCIFFNDSPETLPQIKAFGDIIVMHRLLIKDYRGGRHGYGYGTTGFAAAVFPGSPDAPLIPYSSKTSCHVSDEDLVSIQALRDWFHSPTCPVEKEAVAEGSNDPAILTSVGLQPNQQAQSHNGHSTVRVPLWKVQLNDFCNLLGQVVALYRCPTFERCTIIYLWDGVPETNSDALPHFALPFSDQFRQLLSNADVDPKLATITGHNLSNLVADWTVPLYVYDEHAICPVVSNLRSGDIIRARNVHVQSCRAFNCERPGCLRLVVHGGGHQYGRGVQLLKDSGDPSENIPHELIDSIENGLLSRPFYLQSGDGSIRASLTIYQLCHIPLWMHQVEAGRFNLGATPCLRQSTDPVTAHIPPGSWISNHHQNAPTRSAVLARVSGRITEVFPRTVQDVQDMLVVACDACQCAVRLSSLRDSDGGFCECSSTNGWTTNRNLTTCPFVLIKLEDATGQLVIPISGSSAVQLLTRQSPQRTKWTSTVEELLSSETDKPKTVEVLRNLAGMVSKPVDLYVRMSWLTEWDLGIPTAVDQLDLKVELATEMPLRWTTP